MIAQLKLYQITLKSTWLRPKLSHMTPHAINCGAKRFFDYSSRPRPTSDASIKSFDTALKTENHNDFTAGCPGMKCEDGFVYLYPLVLERMKVPEIEKRVLLL